MNEPTEKGYVVICPSLTRSTLVVLLAASPDLSSPAPVPEVSEHLYILQVHLIQIHLPAQCPCYGLLRYNTGSNQNLAKLPAAALLLFQGLLQLLLCYNMIIDQNISQAEFFLSSIPSPL